MKKYLFLFSAFLVFGLSACSFQSSDSSKYAYQVPNAANAAVIKIASADMSVISIDGKSIYLNARDTTTTLSPGHHSITIGNYMVMLDVVVKANNTYYVKSDGSHVWVENAQGKKVTPVTVLTSI